MALITLIRRRGVPGGRRTVVALAALGIFGASRSLRSSARITHLTARFGYADQPDVPGLLPLIRKAGIECPLDSNKLSHFLSTIELCRGTTRPRPPTGSRSR